MTGVILVIPPGAADYPISHGTFDYQPHAYRADIADPNSPRLIVVPPHVAELLCHNAGFYPMAQESESSFEGTARLYAPYGASCDGIRYDPDAEDIIVVPSSKVAELLSFPPICSEENRPPLDNAAMLERAVADIAVRDERIAELNEQLRLALAEPRPKAARK